VSTEAARLQVVGERIDEILALVPNPMTPDELAAASGLHVRSIRRACASGDLPAIRVGRRWQITYAGVRAWIIQRTLMALVS
jgi:excisionase family DNA binding protein